MVSSSEMVDSGRFTGYKAAVKPSFSQKCSLLSQYLKENGSFGHLGLGTTLTCNAEANGASITRSKPAATTTMNLFPQQAEFNSKDEVPNKNDFIGNKSELASAQMTIFYKGQVIVFNDMPADKAKEIMLLASKTSQKANTFVTDVVAKPAESSSMVSLGSDVNNLAQAHVRRPPQPIVSDLPIARKNSLTRFLEKRKDRISARAPYQTSNSSAASPSQPAQNNSWLGLAAQSLQQFQHQI